MGALILLLFLGAELEAPVRIESQGKPIDVTGGHAAPAVADVDGDKVRDLLVGQFLGEGQRMFDAPVRLYKGPRFDGFTYLPDVSVPSG